MFISKSIAKKFRNSAIPLRYCYKTESNEAGVPKVAVRQVNSIWGKFERIGRQGGVCFSALSGGTARATYTELLSYHTGTEASIQPLILKDYFWRSKMPYNDWPDFLRQAAEKSACFPNGHRPSYHRLKTHNPELLVLRQVVQKPNLFHPSV